jgi:hypothetical protein
MRNFNIVWTVGAAALILGGCESKQMPATEVVRQADAALVDLRPDATTLAPQQLQVAEADLAQAKTDLGNKKYQAVIAIVPKFNQDVATLKDAVVAKQTQLAAASNEWDSLKDEVPKSIEAIQNRVDSLAGAALPKDVSKESLKSAKDELENMKSLWAEATAAYSAGDPAQATDKGRAVQEKGKAVAQQLAMTPV